MTGMLQLSKKADGYKGISIWEQNYSKGGEARNHSLERNGNSILVFKLLTKCIIRVSTVLQSERTPVE